MGCSTTTGFVSTGASITFRADLVGFNRCSVESRTTLVFLCRPLIWGWYKQHLVHLVPVVHLSHTGFLCIAEHARDMGQLYY